MRDVTCVQPDFNTTTLMAFTGDDTNLTEIDDRFCTGGSISKPFDTIVCNDHVACPFRWRPEQWGPVS